MLFTTAILISSCEKKVDPIDTYGVTVEYNGTGTKYVTNDITVNPKDSLIFDFTISSSLEDMYTIEIQKNSGKIDTLNVPASKRRSFSAVKRYVADSVPGDNSYRIMARSNTGKYLGDGNKLFVVTVKNDMNYYSYRFLYAPDSILKVNQNFFSTQTGQSFSYAEGAGNSPKIDFGYFYDTSKTGTTVNASTIYALGANTFALHDLSTWTKNATIFKKITTPTFANITGATVLRSAGIANMGSGTAAKINQLASGNVLLFKTAAGKYGAIQINYINNTAASPSTFVNIDVKIEQ